MTDPSNELLISVATIWEIAIKWGLGKLPLSMPYLAWMNRAITDTNLGVVQVTVEYANAQAAGAVGVIMFNEGIAGRESALFRAGPTDLAIPAVVASGLFELKDVFTPGGPSAVQMTVATVIAFGVGYAAIAWLLRYIEHHSVYVFVWYRIALGALLFAALGAGLISAT